jgi:hypothetical protein
MEPLTELQQKEMELAYNTVARLDRETLERLYLERCQFTFELYNTLKQSSTMVEQLFGEVSELKTLVQLLQLKEKLNG